LSLIDLSEHEPSIDIESSDVSTIGGYVVQQLGHLPNPGESVQVEGFEAEVTSTDGRRIEQLRFTKLPEPDPEQEITEAS